MPLAGLALSGAACGLLASVYIGWREETWVLAAGFLAAVAGSLLGAGLLRPGQGSVARAAVGVGVVALVGTGATYVVAVALSMAGQGIPPVQAVAGVETGPSSCSDARVHARLDASSVEQGTVRLTLQNVADKGDVAVWDFDALLLRGGNGTTEWRTQAGAELGRGESATIVYEGAEPALDADGFSVGYWLHSEHRSRHYRIDCDLVFGGVP